MEYTKGEWEAILWDSGKGFNIFSDEGLIATVPLERGLKHTMHEVKANAHLIASAPALYEALKAVLSTVVCNGDCTISYAIDGTVRKQMEKALAQVDRRE